MINRFKLVIFVCLVISLGACTTNEYEIFVDQKAIVSNENSPTNIFNEMEDALVYARKLKKEKQAKDIIIYVEPGQYYLKSHLVISPALNGLSIIGRGADKVSFKGSVPLSLNWEKFDEHIYVSTLTEKISFDQLVADGNTQILARYPNYDESAHYWQGYAEDALSKERVASWKNPQGALFHALHSGRWGGFHWQIEGVNEDGTPVLKGGHQNNRGSKPHKEYRMVENVFEELDSPGEWYLDEKENKLYYWPATNININTAHFEASVLKDLVQIVGTLDNPVVDVRISGIKFEGTQRTLFEAYEPLLRSDWTIYRGSALFFEGTEGCAVEDCEFTKLGGNVIMASKYNKGLEIKGNHIHECGASAISFVGDASAVRSPSFNYGQFVDYEDMDTIHGPKNELYPRQCLVYDNLIHRIGRIEKQSAGVQISMAMDITVSHNSIYDVPRAGINIGDGTWGGHVLEYNDVFNTVLETSDHGSFNSWGRDRFWHPKRHVMDSLTSTYPSMPKWDAIHTTIIRNNRFRCDHGWDIDLDDGSSNYHIYNNLCLNNGIKLREGFYRVVENNITVNNSLHPHVWFASSEDVFRKNIVMDAYQDVGLLGWGKELDHNLFPNEAAMLKSQIYDRDIHSSYGDPMFKDPENLDFTVDANSPAIKLGFVNFPMDVFGVEKQKFKAMAKTPEVPQLIARTESNQGKSPVVSWLRNQLKSVDSEQEQSAYGLNTAEGVIVLRTWKHSPAVKNKGLKKGDVILEVEGVSVNNTVDFLKENRKYQEKGEMNVVVMRNQKENSLLIYLK
ncbi:PDZ domain-containing protein [Saccharicrinis fermentans]|uniref:Peptidase Do n=1 Tax=Saccharicrinis fermentans DSM 9555 = JCM 21142 TaxID=869213 RepID=W7Y2Y8_9BACT|nr:PDZ domain-containing protein [Saccharicrinis fermentans]GAF01948.1 peptidase Do [Saccharicrinis fermentans DSM 9555 = JCM 21142]